jgi:hypothetical protein
MTVYSIYRADTGYFTGALITCSGAHLSANVPEGCSCLLGTYDHLSQRVDLETGAVIYYQPPQPSEQHEWNDDLRRWVYVPTALETCLANRRDAYPPLQDLADALYWQAQGNDGPMQAYLARCKDVKTKFPKP